MDAATWWGLIFLVYVMGGGLWLLSWMNGEHEKLNARKAFYPGAKELRGRERLLPSVLWIGGLLFLFLLYRIL